MMVNRVTKGKDSNERGGTIFCLWFYVIPALAASEPLHDTKPQSQRNEVEVITVSGQDSLAFLRARMQSAENAFFDLYNSLTDKEEYRISCSIKKSITSNVVRRVCEPKYIDLIKYQHTQASLDTGSNREFLKGKLQNLPTSTRFRTLIAQKRKEHLHNVETILTASPALQQKLIALNEAKARYQQKKNADD